MTVCTNVHTLEVMDDAEWEPRKAAANLKKHGVDFADAATVLHDEQAITVLISARHAKPRECEQYGTKP